MIVELIVKAVAALARGLAALLGDLPAPAFLSTALDSVGDLLSNFGGLGAWVPWGFVGDVFTAVMAAMVIGFGIKVVRIVLSLFTAGGGSAA